MKSDHYATRTKKRTRKKESFRTDQIAIRGFARELKAKLLDGNKFSLEEPEYKSVSEAFTDLWEKQPIQRSFIGESGFSKWWNGRQYPDPQQRKDIDKLFPGLSTKWFDRTKFEDRMQLHLASLDLFHMSRNCNCQDGENPETELETHCDACLLQALNEAEWVLRQIHDDWKPVHTGFYGAFDVCISGPKERSGLNVIKNVFESAIFDKPYDQKRLIAYDLSLGDCSFIGLPFPEEIMKIYQDENPFSIVLFLFLLVGLDLKMESEYRDDLVLDFMTALNCAGMIMYVKHRGLFGRQTDFLEAKIQTMLFQVAEYFYEEPFDLNQSLLQYEDLCRQSEETGKPSFEGILHPTTHLSSHGAVNLSELFLEILKFVMKEQDVDSFMSDINEDSYSGSYKVSKVDEYLSSPYLQVFKSLEVSRERYLKLFDIIGYSRKELISELSKTVCLPANITIRPGDTPFKKSPYSKKMTFTESG